MLNANLNNRKRDQGKKSPFEEKIMTEQHWGEKATRIEKKGGETRKTRETGGQQGTEINRLEL